MVKLRRGECGIMKKLILVSMLYQTTDLVRTIAPELEGKTVTYIPTAGIAEEVEGMGFAIPINDALKLVEEIIDTGKVNRPTIGISALSLDSYSSYELYMYRIQTNLNKGIYVADVQSNSPASKAGIQAGDVITQFDGKDIESYKDFLTQLYSKNPGDTVKLTINRNGSTSSVNVTLGSS